MDSEYPLGMSESKFVEESRPMEVSSLQKIEEEQEDESKLENSGDSLVVGQNINNEIKSKYIERKNVTKNVENSEQSEEKVKKL